jgi:hypothetical protein
MSTNEKSDCLWVQVRFDDSTTKEFCIVGSMTVQEFQNRVEQRYPEKLVRGVQFLHGPPHIPAVAEVF